MTPNQIQNMTLEELLEVVGFRFQTGMVFTIKARGGHDGKKHHRIISMVVSVPSHVPKYGLSVETEFVEEDGYDAERRSGCWFTEAALFYYAAMGYLALTNKEWFDIEDEDDEDWD